MKKIAMMLIALTMTVAMQAQTVHYEPKTTSPFHSGKPFVGASLSGFDINYSSFSDVTLDLKAQLGYLFFDNVLGYAELGYNNGGKGHHTLDVGAGGRCYIEQNGMFVGAKVMYRHAHNFNDLQPGVEIGYAFFLSRSVTIEPSIYYNQSFKNHSDYSNIGLKIGFGVYLND